MINLIEQIKHGQRWVFRGGIHPLQNKEQSNKHPILAADIPNEIVLPLKQHIGTSGQIIVCVGERVLKGQPLTSSNALQCVPVHAPTSGIIVEIKPKTIPHPSGLSDMCIVIHPDFIDEWHEKTPVPDYLNASPDHLIDHIRKMGISGMGGAGFPSAQKLQSGLGRTGILIINGVECEPYITADDRLMREHANEIIDGLEILRRIVKPSLTVLAVEDNKPEAIAALQNAVDNKPDIVVQILPTKYPSGAEKQLIKIITGKNVPMNTIPTAIGFMVQNISTVFAIKRAVINGEPLIQRVVTFTGNTLSEQGNRWVLLGTPVRFLLNKHGFKPDTTLSRIIIGGPMMGFTLPHLDVPITKMTNCVLAPTRKEIPPSGSEMPCIRCSACADVCPASLLPQQLLWYAKDKDHDKCKHYNLQNCIECGACAYVCPSQIPLVQYYRQAKSDIRAQHAEKQAATLAKARFDAKKARMAEEKIQRAARSKLAAENRRKSQEISADKDAIAAAIARVKAKAEERNTVDTITPPSPIGNSVDMRAVREERKSQARAFQANLIDKNAPPKTAPLTSTEPSVLIQSELDTLAVQDFEKDAKKAAIAAAIERVKARKSLQTNHNEDK